MADEFVEKFNALAVFFGDDWTPVLEQCRTILLGGIEENFLAAASSSMQHWPPRKDPGPKHPLLIETGDLYRAAIGEGGAASVDRIEDGRSIILGVNKDGGGGSIAGAGRHQDGDPPPGILPRPFMGISQENMDKCDGVLIDYVFEQFDEVFS